ncbi:MAG: rRNA adenine N-6-methyltransferase family protein, partial [Deefgea sp.]
MAHIPRKRFGQNFLQDQGVIAGIINAVDPQAGDVIVEIGPGLAALTTPLLARVPQLNVVEIDRDIVSHLSNIYPP